MAALTVRAVLSGGIRQIVAMEESAMKEMETSIDEASSFIQTGDIDNQMVYIDTCVKLGSAIDACIAMNAFPSSPYLLQLAFIIKEVCKRKTELLVPPITLLMLPVKVACQIGWFPNGDKDSFLKIVKEVSYAFSNTEKMSVDPSNAHSNVANIVSRFYPTMKVAHILTSFVVKAGYGTFVADFHISLGTTPSHCRNLWLLVAQLDNMDTAACINSPSRVEFLINGTGVPKRTKIDMGKGPQLPSDITKMIKYRVNLVQAIGSFDGQYFIALVFMNPVSPDPSQLQDYVRPMPVGVGSGNQRELQHPSSRISLYCPISQQRIKTPVKGHLCNHLQCFDYDNFIELNSTTPTWKCPLCNNPVCNRDLRIDRDFLKVLNEVPQHVTDVILSDDTTGVPPGGETQVNARTTAQTQCTTTAGSRGQTKVNVRETDQEAKTTTPPAATVTKPAISRGLNTRTTAQPQAQSTTVSTPHVGFRGQTLVNAFATNEPTAMLTPPAEASGDASRASKRMRGSLTGAQLEAARLKYLAPPRQSQRANEPWSRPAVPSLPTAFITPQIPPTNSDHNG